jgi:YVTN family beta-propeller protein
VSLSTLSNTVKVIKTADNSVVMTTYVDRGPHEAFFTSDNRTLWIGTRGVSSVQVVDGMNGTTLSRIATGRGPSKVLFSPDGATAYVNHIFEPLIAVVDVRSRTVRYNITGLASAFSSDMMLSADGKSLWAAHKMTGQVSVIDTAARKVISILETGAETNHPNFVIVNGTTYGWVSVGSLNATRIYQQSAPHLAPVHIKDVRQSGVQPHGLWPSADNTRMYIINEHSDTVDVVDTSLMKVVDTIAVGQESQALIYVPNAISSDLSSQAQSRENLSRQGLGMRVESKLLPVFDGNGTKPNANAQVTVRQIAGLDMVQVIGRNLVLNRTYTLSAECRRCRGARLPLVSFNASMPTTSGCGSAPQTLAFLRFFDVYDMSTVEVREGKD